MKSTNPLPTFSRENFYSLCLALSSKDPDLKAVIDTYGYPPMWTRDNTFETLVHIILEQQVSLASALAALNKLREKLKKVTPGKLLALSDEELRSCYCSRQKIVYIRSLANAVQNKEINLKAMEKMSDEEVRAKLITLKGIGHWTIDVYLIFVLRRTDIFPVGDLAAINGLKQIKQLSKDTKKEKLVRIIGKWSPYRTIATMIVWHYYLSTRTKQKSKEAEKIQKAIIVT